MPQEKDLLIAMRMRDTAFKRVLGNMKRGTKVKIQIMAHSMHESFTLHDNATNPAVFVIGGIGIVPAFSIIKDALERKLPHKLTLIYSNRSPEDAPFLAELQQLAKQYKNFTFVPTMTNAENWPGTTGRINEPMLRKYVKNLDAPVYYVAGLSEMVSTMKDVLNNLGIDSQNVHAEEFTGFDLNQLTNVTNKKWKTYLPLVLIGLLIFSILLIHTGAISSLSHMGVLGSISLSNPLSYPLIGLVLLIILVKIAAIIKVKRSLHGNKNKPSLRQIVEAHKITRKEE
jgi:ferredoxin-NADP reductase